MAEELTGVLLALFPGLAKAWLTKNNTKNSKLQLKSEKTQVNVRISGSKSNLTVVNCVKTGEKADVTHFYHKTLFASLRFKTVFHVSLGARASIFFKAVYADISTV